MQLVLQLVLQLVHTTSTYNYSGTSLQRTLWELKERMLYRGFHYSEVFIEVNEYINMNIYD